MTSPDSDTCAVIFAMVEDDLDRELTPDELARVERHLLTCALCASEFRLEERLMRDLRGKIQRIQAPPDLHARVWKGLVTSLRSGNFSKASDIEGGDSGKNG